jgi:hypothetical protein
VDAVQMLVHVQELVYVIMRHVVGQGGGGAHNAGLTGYDLCRFKNDFAESYK